MKQLSSGWFGQSYAQTYFHFIANPRFTRILLLHCLFCLLFTSLFAGNLPSGFKETRLAQKLDPVDLQIAPDGRLFVTEKNGKVRIIKNDQLLGKPFLNLQVDNFNERGLMGLTFDPNFASNQYVYVYYTVKGANHNRVSRFKANGDEVAKDSETVLIDIDRTYAGNHNGGALYFKDGKLFITTGDGAYALNSQSMNTLLGKILRINPDGSIPSDNPFYTKTSGKYRSIWALGLRNPFKASVQPGTGKVLINDVGGSLFEEVNEILPGKNYGWPFIEGHRTIQIPPANYQDPVFVYPRSQGCSITGGAFYNPTHNQFPSEYRGKYLYADYCGGYIKTLDLSQHHATANFATGIDRPIDVKIAPDGTLYYIARGGKGGGSTTDNTSSEEGSIWKVQYTGSGLPSISAHPGNLTAPVGGSATFQVSASGNGTLRYQWQRNQQNIPGATAASYTLSNLKINDNGAAFRCVVSNQNGSATSNSATLTVTANQAPTASISAPASSFLYTAGQSIQFAGTGTDPEQGELPASAFTWKIDFHHDDHHHPALEASTGSKNGSYQVPRSGETASNVWFRIYLTVRDNQGLSHTTFRDVYPVKSQITLSSSPSGLQLKLDGKTVTTPYSFTGVAGVTRTIEAVSPQSFDNKTFQFGSWSNQGARIQDIQTPSVAANYKASFNQTSNNSNQGLNYAYYEGDWVNLPDFAALSVKKTGKVSGFDLSPRQRDSYFGFEFSGSIHLPNDGDYTFYTNSDDGSRLYINNQLVVDNDGLHSLTEKSGTINLKKGKHAIRVTYFERAGEEILEVRYAGPGISKQLIPTSVLTPDTESGLSGSYVLTARHSGMALNVRGNALHNGGNVEQSNRNDTPAQIWLIAPAEDGYYTLTSKLSGKLLETAGVSMISGANVQQWERTGGNNQKWKLVPVDNGYYTLIAKHSGMALDVAFAGTASGTNVQQWNRNNTHAQMWKLEKMSSARISTETEGLDVNFQVHPNPAIDKLIVSYEALAAGKAQITVLDVMSKARTHQPFQLVEGTNAVDLDVSHLEKGLYFVRVIDQGRIVTKKVLIDK